MVRPPNHPLLQVPNQTRASGQVRKITSKEWHRLACQTVETFSLKAAEWAATKGLRLLFLILILKYGSPVLTTVGKEILKLALK